MVSGTLRRHVFRLAIAINKQVEPEPNADVFEIMPIIRIIRDREFIFLGEKGNN